MHVPEACEFVYFWKPHDATGLPMCDGTRSQTYTLTHAFWKSNQAKVQVAGLSRADDCFVKLFMRCSGMARKRLGSPWKWLPRLEVINNLEVKVGTEPAGRNDYHHCAANVIERRHLDFSMAVRNKPDSSSVYCGMETANLTCLAAEGRIHAIYHL